MPLESFTVAERIRGPHAELIVRVSTGQRRSTVSKVAFFILVNKRRVEVHEGSESELLGAALHDKLGLPMNYFDSEQSKFFKRHYNADKHNLGPLVKEMDVIRRIEGW